MCIINAQNTTDQTDGPLVGWSTLRYGWETWRCLRCSVIWMQWPQINACPELIAVIECLNNIFEGVNICRGFRTDACWSMYCRWWTGISISDIVSKARNVNIINFMHSSRFKWEEEEEEGDLLKHCLWSGHQTSHREISNVCFLRIVVSVKKLATDTTQWHRYYALKCNWDSYTCQSFGHGKLIQRNKQTDLSEEFSGEILRMVHIRTWFRNSWFSVTPCFQWPVISGLLFQRIKVVLLLWIHVGVTYK